MWCKILNSKHSMALFFRFLFIVSAVIRTLDTSINFIMITFVIYVSYLVRFIGNTISQSKRKCSAIAWRCLVSIWKINTMRLHLRDVPIFWYCVLTTDCYICKRILKICYLFAFVVAPTTTKFIFFHSSFLILREKCSTWFLDLFVHSFIAFFSLGHLDDLKVWRLTDINSYVCRKNIVI